MKTKTIKISYNVNHDIWKPLVNDANTVEFKSSTFSLILIIALTHETNKENSDNKLTNMLGIKKEENNLIGLMDQVIKYGLDD